MSTIQDDRILSITTPLGKDFLLLQKMSASEKISELFNIEVELLHAEESQGYKSETIDEKKILGQSVTIEIRTGGEESLSRKFNGIVTRFSQGNRTERFSFYHATIVPKLWLLTQKSQSRIFQHITVPAILNKVLGEWGIEKEVKLQGEFKPRNFCVQYRETDFEFISRLMEEEGIYYYFKHSDGSHKMVIADTPPSHDPCPDKSTVPYLFEAMGRAAEWVGDIKTWRVEHYLQTGKVTFWDHKFEETGKNYENTLQTKFPVSGNTAYEFYEYQGGYTRKYDGIDKSGGERPKDLENIMPDGRNTAKYRMEMMDSQYMVANGVSDCCSLTAGHRFTLKNHPNSEYNKQYVLISILHEVEQPKNYISGEEVAEPYEASFTCIPFDVPYRPPLTTPKPVVRGSQTATVVGPPGEEIFTDKYGRVKAQFHWDREGKKDADSSCWMRVGTLWAGEQWGVVHIPRIGQEVIVDFIEGDPDQPIIVGSVYNNKHMPPYDLPDNKTQSGVKSRSSKGGGPDNFNEFRFEDKKGKEEIYLHAEKDWTIMVENDKNQIVGHDETHHVKHDRTKTVDNDETTTVVHNRTETVGSGGDKEKITIKGFREETVEKDETITIIENRTRDVLGNHTTSVKKDEKNSVTLNRTDSVGKNYTLSATDKIEESASVIKLNAGTKLELNGPGGQIKIEGGIVTITGAMVKIN